MITIDLTKEKEGVNIHFTGNVIYAKDGGGDKNYATKEYVEEEIKKIEIPNTDNLETKNESQNKLKEAKSYTDNEIKKVVDNAPESLNTLNKLASATNTNKESIKSLDSAVKNKVDKSYVDENFQPKDDYLTKTEAKSSYQPKGNYVPQTIFEQAYRIIQESFKAKQDLLKSGENIKTINGESVLGSGDINISGLKWSILKNIPTVGDVAYWDGNKVKTVPLSNWDTSLGTPVGVVVIPEGFLPDKKARILSLKYATYNDNEKIPWGVYDGYQYDSPLETFSYIVATDNAIGDSYETRMGYLPSDIDTWTGEQSIVDPLCKYDYEPPYIPSPYLGNKLNPDYIMETEGGNVLSDFNGLSNTQLLVNEGQEYHAAHACWNYKDSANSNLQWYLPSAGELGFLMPRFKIINNTLAAVNGTNINSSKNLLCSNENMIDVEMFTFVLECGDGCLDGEYYAKVDGYARAFALI